MKNRGEAIILPFNPAPHVSDWFVEIGPSISGAMGEAPIGWADMTAWQALTGIELDVWEATTIRRMSAAFVGQRRLAEQPNCPEPRLDPDQVDQSQRDRVTSQFAAMMRIVPAITEQ